MEKGQAPKTIRLAFQLVAIAGVALVISGCRADVSGTNNDGGTGAVTGSGTGGSATRTGGTGGRSGTGGAASGTPGSGGSTGSGGGTSAGGGTSTGGSPSTGGRTGTGGNVGGGGARGTGGGSGTGRDAGVGDGSVAGSGGSAGTAVDAGSTLEAATQLCVDTINMYRATLGLAPYVRWNAQEACTASEALMDSVSGTAHSAFGMCSENAQDECPGWTGSLASIVTGCLAQMWAEGPGTDFATHGHYLNMSNARYTMASCGFATAANGRIWAAQNFR